MPMKMTVEEVRRRAPTPEIATVLLDAATKGRLYFVEGMGGDQLLDGDNAQSLARLAGEWELGSDGCYDVTVHWDGPARDYPGGEVFSVGRRGTNQYTRRVIVRCVVVTPREDE